MTISIVGAGKSSLARALRALKVGGYGAMEAFGRLVSPHRAYNLPHRTVGSAMAGLLDRGEEFRNRPGFGEGIERKFNSRWV